MVMVTGKFAKTLIREYLAQPGSHCDRLPVSGIYYAYGIGSVDLEIPADWETVHEGDCWCEVGPAEHAA
jgi:hypothetical protein